ncbi:SpoIIE family protein phosphatase [Streptomyces sp. NPDC001315]|uniref:SpoIIE family protein phosphatase n=1 Tax=Streptomyces sp. NPDC001315 TaxID=3364562 RepID=UPI0036877CBE
MNSHEPLGQRHPLPPGTVLDTALAVVVADADGRITHWSEAARALWGHTAPEIVGRPLADLFTEAGGGPRHRSGRPLRAQVHAVPLSEDGGEAGFLLTARPDAPQDAAGPEPLKGWAFDQHPFPLSVHGPDARVLHVNEALVRATGCPEEQHRGRLITEIAQGDEYEDVMNRIRRVLETGKPEFAEHFHRLPGEPSAHAWAMDVYPLEDASGRVRGAAVSSYDYSEQYDSRERLALLGEARTRIGSSLDVAGTARELAEVTVPRFADVVCVDLLDAVVRGDQPLPVGPGPVRLNRAAVRAAYLVSGQQPAAGETAYHPASSPVARCLATGQAEMHHVTHDAVTRWFAEDPVHAAQAQECGTHSLIAVPIRARDTVLGAALFLRCAPHHEPFTHDDLAITEDLITRVGISIDNARRFTRERGVALALQRALLPPGPAPHAAAETAARYLPAGGGDAQVGGDWFDVIPLPGARVGLVVGDVVGHGIAASATMGRLRTAVRTLADIDLPPEELLTHLDDIVTHDAAERSDVADEIPSDVGATCLYAVYDPVAGTCSLARAGHPAPILVHPDGTSDVVDAPAGPPLGLGSLPFEAAEVTLSEGSLLALFTNGLLAAGDVDERMDELRHALAQPSSSLDALCDGVLRTMNPEPAGDDSTLLLARPRVFGWDRVAEWDVPVDPAAVAEARRRATQQLDSWGLEHVAFITEVVVSELVTNAIRHATGPIRLRLIRNETLVCEVSDGSSTSPHLRRARLHDEGGRGLFLVAELTQRWGTRYTRSGKTIWAEQLLPNR